MFLPCLWGWGRSKILCDDLDSWLGLAAHPAWVCGMSSPPSPPVIPCHCLLILMEQLLLATPWQLDRAFLSPELSTVGPGPWLCGIFCNSSCATSLTGFGVLVVPAPCAAPFPGLCCWSLLELSSRRAGLHPAQPQLHPWLHSLTWNLPSWTWWSPRGSVQGQTELGFEQSALVEGVPACDARAGSKSLFRFFQTQLILQLAWWSLGCVWPGLPSPDLTLNHVFGLFWDQSHHRGLVLANPDSYLQAVLLTLRPGKRPQFLPGSPTARSTWPL